MRRPLVLIHGYSAEGRELFALRAALQAKGIDAKDIKICNYISLNNEITVKDIAEGLERAFRAATWWASSMPSSIPPECWCCGPGSPTTAGPQERTRVCSGSSIWPDWRRPRGDWAAVAFTPVAGFLRARRRGTSSVKLSTSSRVSPGFSLPADTNSGAAASRVRLERLTSFLAPSDSIQTGADVTVLPNL